MNTINLDLEPKKILIVGGQSGIGEAVAEMIEGAVLGADLFVPNEEAPLDDRFGELDVRSETSIKNYLSENGPFDYIVYTPGVNRLAYVEDVSQWEMVDQFSVNVFGFSLMMGAHSQMFGRCLKSAVAIVSDAARNPMRGSLNYCSSKAALAQSIKVIAREWAGETRVNGVAPAIVDDTPMTEYIDETVPLFRGWDPVAARKYEESMLPMKRRVTKDEVAHVVVNTLFGPEYQTGTIVEISGGK